MNLTKSDIKNFYRLMKHAEKNSPSRRTHFAAGRIGKVLHFARNSYSEISDRRIFSFYEYPCPHAEFELFRSTGFQKIKTVYVLRLSAGGKLLESRPCSDCASFMRLSGVKRVIYSTPTGMKLEVY
jgi:hypothetical protein